MKWAGGFIPAVTGKCFTVLRCWLVEDILIVYSYWLRIFLLAIL